MKKKGFTLIELLAVIVILAVIALIVAPIVTGIIKQAKESANARSVEGHIVNIEYSISGKMLSSRNISNYDIIDGTLSDDISVSENDGIVCSLYTIKNGKVMEAKYCSYDNWNKIYNYSASTGAYSIEFKGTIVSSNVGETHKGIIYMDPSNISNSCNEDSILTSTNTGCKKFYIFDDTGNSYKMIMDRNTTAKIAWINHDDYIASGGTESDWTARKFNKQGPVTITKQLKIDTSNWIGSPRLIREEEVRTLTGNSGTDSYYFGSNGSTAYDAQTEAQQAIQRSYYWLLDYTKDCTVYGCRTADSSTTGYWTSDIVSGDISDSWFVNRKGYFNHGSDDVTGCGVRPVITLPKSIFVR